MGNVSFSNLKEIVLRIWPPVLFVVGCLFLTKLGVANFPTLFIPVGLVALFGGVYLHLKVNRPEVNPLDSDVFIAVLLVGLGLAIFGGRATLAVVGLTMAVTFALAKFTDFGLAKDVVALFGKIGFTAAPAPVVADAVLPEPAVQKASLMAALTLQCPNAYELMAEDSGTGRSFKSLIDGFATAEQEVAALRMIDAVRIYDKWEADQKKRSRKATTSAEAA